MLELQDCLRREVKVFAQRGGDVGDPGVGKVSPYQAQVQYGGQVFLSSYPPLRE